MKIIKRIILIMIMILVLSSCGHKKEKEITYTMSEEVVIEDITNYDEEIWIPSHQYLHLKFENNTTYYTYEMRVQKWCKDDKGTNEDYSIDREETRYETNILNNPNAKVSNYIATSTNLFFLDNDKEFYFNIYNESSQNFKYRIRLNNTSYSGVGVRLNDVKVENLKLDIDENMHYRVNADCYSTKHVITIIGDAGISFKIKDYNNLLADSNTIIDKKYLSFGLYEYNICLDNNAESHKPTYHVYIYNNGSTGKQAECQMFVDVQEIKNGSQIVDTGYYAFYTDIDDDNEYKFECDIQFIRLEVMKVINVDLLGGKKRYLVWINNTTPERLAGKITISCA